jgi:predicted O-methyltransferase YrrM
VGTRHGRLLYHLVSYYQPDLIIEMGTAFGISTLYLALANPATPVITVEGNAHYAAIAAKIFNAVQLGNITLINRPFNETVEELRSRITPRTLIFIDGNHTLEATWQYFGAFTSTLRSPTILVFDDINWSEEMRQAWKKITESPDSGTTIDLFRMGIVFPGKGKGNYRLLY